MSALRQVTRAQLRRLSRHRQRPFVRRLAGFAHRLYLAYENFDYDPATNGEYEILRKIAAIEPRAVIFDVGANVGNWALAAAALIPNAQIHCFELAGALATQLQANVAAEKRIKANAFGLADREGDVDFTFYPDTPILTSMYEYPHGMVSVRDKGRVRTGDAYMQEQGINHISLLKLDVEGAEPLVLKGFSDAMEQQKIDAVQFEYGRINLASGFFLRDFYALFERHGFALGKIYPTYVEFREYHPLHEDLLGPNFMAVRKTRTDLIETLGKSTNLGRSTSTTPSHGKRNLFITNDFPPMIGGLSTLYSRLCAAAPPNFVVVLAPRFRGSESFDENQHYPIVRRWAPTSMNPIARLLQIGSLLIATLGHIKRGGVKRVHLGHLYLAPIGLVMRWLYRIPFVVYLHGGDMAGYTRWRSVRSIARRILQDAELVVVNSAYTLHAYRALGLDLPNIQILTMPASLERFQPGLDATPIRIRYGLDGAKVLLTVGRLVERKGHDMVIKALPDVVKVMGDVRYIIAGSGPDEERLKALARKMNCANRVIFVGEVPNADLPLLYAACDVFVMPSRTLSGRDGVEGFGIVFLEAGASGKPAVGGRSGGISEAVVEGTTGILVDPSKPEELGSALIELLSNPSEAERLGALGRERAAQLDTAWVQAVERIWAG